MSDDWGSEPYMSCHNSLPIVPLFFTKRLISLAILDSGSDHLFFRKVLFFRKSGNKIVRICLLFHQDSISGNLNFRKYFMSRRELPCPHWQGFPVHRYAYVWNTWKVFQHRRGVFIPGRFLYVPYWKLSFI